MESVIFWTTFSALLVSRSPYLALAAAPRMRMNLMKENGNKLTTMKESQEWFTIKLDNEAYPVYRVVQADESVVFLVQMEDRKIKLFKGDNETWFGDAEQDLIDRIGKAIEETP
jgi:hypothetical protein